MSATRVLPRRRFAASLAIASLALAACGGGDDGAAGDTSTPLVPATSAPTGATEPDDETTSAPTSNTTSDDSTSDTTGGAASTTDTGEAATVDRDALPPVFRLSGPTIDGTTIDLAEYADQPLLLWFWAPF